MPPTNDFLPFAIGSGANVESQSAYASDALLPIGNQPGPAISAFNNKALRQANAVASQVAQMVANQLNSAVQDNGVPAQLLAQLQAAILPLPSITTIIASGSGTFNATFAFFLSSANATAGATYTNNGVAYTVSNTIAAGALLYATGSGAPTVSGVLTKTSGTGDATITFYAIRAPTALKVRMLGGGGGGAGSGTGSQTQGGNGNISTFGSSFLVANPGAAGITTIGSNGGAGGTASIGSGASGLPLSGGSGGANGSCSTSGAVFADAAGGLGAPGVLGGGGGNGYRGTGGATGSPNTGGGGGGAGIAGTSGGSSGCGGGAGGYVEATIPSPAASYAYSVGAGGVAGSAGGLGSGGGAGGSGVIIVETHF